MNSLSNRIYNYLFAHFAELPLDKQVHFASRLWMWNEDSQARRLLDALRPIILLSDDPQTSLSAISNGQLLPLHPGNESLQALRQPYNERYPALRANARLLYWGLELEACYGIDARQALQSLLLDSELNKLANELQRDKPALAMLSTHAVNFLYLYHRYIKTDEGTLTAVFWMDIATDKDLYDSSDAKQLQLQIYLLTHAVIGETLFYQRPIPAEKLAGYRQLVQTLENLLATNLERVSLDNKLEFLVSCHLVNYKSKLEMGILAEAERSVSPAGDFLVDIHNTNKSTFTSFDKSEHRSVLYLMAMLPRN